MCNIKKQCIYEIKKKQTMGMHLTFFFSDGETLYLLWVPLNNWVT